VIGDGIVSPGPAPPSTQDRTLEVSLGTALRKGGAAKDKWRGRGGAAGESAADRVTTGWHDRYPVGTNVAGRRRS